MSALAAARRRRSGAALGGRVGPPMPTEADITHKPKCWVLAPSELFYEFRFPSNPTARL